MTGLSPSDMSYSEPRELVLPFGLQLYDGFTLGNTLLGTVEVRVQGKPFAPYAKPTEATYLFFDLPGGNHTLEVRSDPDTPYYVPVDIDVTLPMAGPRWPVLPERGKADTTKPLRDNGQPAAFRAQLDLATLQPAVAYPFPRGATVLRGKVEAGGVALVGARVRRTTVAGDDDLQYTTTPDGDFVLFFSDIPFFGADKNLGEPITLRVSHPAHPDTDHAVRVRRGATTTTTITMAP